MNNNQKTIGSMSKELKRQFKMVTFTIACFSGILAKAESGLNPNSNISNYLEIQKLNNISTSTIKFISGDLGKLFNDNSFMQRD